MHGYPARERLLPPFPFYAQDEAWVRYDPLLRVQRAPNRHERRLQNHKVSRSTSSALRSSPSTSASLAL